MTIGTIGKSSLCAGCVFFKPGTSVKKLVESDGTPVKIGECRRYPPRAPVLGDLSTWPPVADSDYCGEFEERR
jgi:hypothetical protein